MEGRGRGRNCAIMDILPQKGEKEEEPGAKLKVVPLAQRKLSQPGWPQGVRGAGK